MVWICAYNTRPRGRGSPWFKAVKSVHTAVCVSSVQWMMGNVVRGEAQQWCSARVHVTSE